jgi:CBS domain-containing protein
VRVPAEYAADFLDQIAVGDACSTKVVTLPADSVLGDAGHVLDTHQGFPVVDANQHVIGVVTRRDFLGKPPSTRVRDLITRGPSVVFPDMSLREAADHMVRENVGRLPVVARDNPRRLIGIVTRSDLLTAHAQRLREG